MFLRRSATFFIRCSIPSHAANFSSNAIIMEKIQADKMRIENLRNIGISAHIDSGKTTLTERILYYTGRIDAIHEVRGKDGVGAKMDSMELEREKGITIQSAATYCRWKGKNINIIDTPGHVDFTIEVERALRVLDSAILVLCGVSGVQSQTMTVDRQMRRYDIPRIAFINKLDRLGANPFMVIDKMRSKLKHEAVAMQIPIGLEGALEGVIDLITMKAIYFKGENGNDIEVTEVIPNNLIELAQRKRSQLIESVANVNDSIADYFLAEKDPPIDILKKAIRDSTISRSLIPVFMGAAYKNVGVQLLLDGVDEYLPNPSQVTNTAIDCTNNEKVILKADSESTFVGLAFKLEESRFGQLTYMRVYQGKLSRGSMIQNTNGGRRVKVPRLVRMHANEMEDVDEVGAGEICAMFGVECSSGDTFMDANSSANTPLSMTPMHVPDPVISLSITPSTKDNTNFTKALARFQKEDPTFRVHTDPESNETIISGMGELHLEIYVERMRREYNCPCTTGKPRVAFRESIGQKATFDYTHKKQSGGAGQFARVAGYIEPLADWHSESDDSTRFNNEFTNQVIGGVIPTEFIPACEKGFIEATVKGSIIGHQSVGIRLVLNDGSAHVVDSNEYSFRSATIAAFRQAMAKARPLILEPIMKVSITVPIEFQGVVLGTINKRKGLIIDTDTQEDTLVVTADVPLNNMFGYSTELRSITQGKGEFSMEYKTYAPVPSNTQAELVAEYQKRFSSAK